jgi:hypothetical protein
MLHNTCVASGSAYSESFGLDSYRKQGLSYMTVVNMTLAYISVAYNPLGI